MPHVFYAVAGWVIARMWRAAALAIVLLASLLAFGMFVGQLSLTGPRPITLQAVLIASSVILCFWLAMVVVWFDPRTRSSRGVVSDWLQALFLDSFLIFAAVVLTIAASAS